MRVAIPFVLPPTLPIKAAPPRLVERVEEQQRIAKQTLLDLDWRRRVEIIPCGSQKSLIVQLCARRSPIEIVLAGSGSWALKHAIYGLAPVVVVPSRARFYRMRRTAGPPVLES